jgi:hypothetical protein
MQVKFQFWSSSLTPWHEMFQAAADFANELPPNRLINISHSSDQNRGVVTVWYWGDDEPTSAGHM